MRCSILITAILCAASTARGTILSLTTPPGVDPIVLPGGTLSVSVLAADNVDLSAVQVRLDLSGAADATVTSAGDIAAGSLFDGMAITLLPSPSVPAAIVYFSDLFTEISQDGEVAAFTLTFPSDAQPGTAWISFDPTGTLITDGNDGGIREYIPVSTGAPLAVQVVPEPSGLLLVASLVAVQFLRAARPRRES